jgi:hypothetical protein
MSLARLLKNLPHKTWLAELPSLFHMLIVSLQLEDPALKISTLETLKFMVGETPELIRKQMTALTHSLFSILSISNRSLGNDAVFSLT